jgi:hypothetical protein
LEWGNVGFSLYNKKSNHNKWIRSSFRLGFVLNSNLRNYKLPKIHLRIIITFYFKTQVIYYQLVTLNFNVYFILIFNK